MKKEILKDMAYYELNDGGVTFSGGEPLLQIDKLEDLLESLDINICTSLFLSDHNLFIVNHLHLNHLRTFQYPVFLEPTLSI